MAVTSKTTRVELCEKTRSERALFPGYLVIWGLGWVSGGMRGEGARLAGLLHHQLSANPHPRSGILGGSTLPTWR